MSDDHDWSDRSRREAEEQLRCAQESKLMRVLDLSPHPFRWAHGKVQWLEAKEGATVQRVELRGTFPDTRLVIVFTVFRDQAYSGCTFSWHTPIWRPDGAMHDFEFLGVRLVEFLAKKLKQYRDCEPGSTLDVGGVMPPSEYGQGR